MTTTFEVFVPEEAAQLKDQANALYTAKSFSDSALLYTRIVNHFHDNCPPQFIRTIYSNRAACHIELGQYHNAIEDVRNVLKMTPPGVKVEHIIQKAHLRLARCLYETGRYGDAIKELDTWRETVGNTHHTETESALRSKILQAIVMRDENDNQKSAKRHYLELPSFPRRSLRYEVKVQDRISGDTVIKYDYYVPTALCSPHPPEIPTRLFLIQLLQNHHNDVMGRRQWTCWRCSAPAVSLVHTPASYLHMEEPLVIDYAQPVCKNGGVCDLVARQMMRDEMWLVAELAKSRR
ncbi:hypothetical protein CPB84DRAFT_1798274 [Gymnopilus junonius]|uniref:Uncharacterized protein n=1 Tax=Gymnopilus junonius TaxID=109634 RepID=A0A9P5TF86_GYMJU|nr:hypothetical protein CPB84DRAFT_1798274 [Gymnopilus junonius]